MEFYRRQGIGSKDDGEQSTVTGSSALYTNGDNEMMESLSKWSDATYGLCFDPIAEARHCFDPCVEARHLTRTSSIGVGACTREGDIGELTPISELTPATAETSHVPLSILMFDVESVDESACFTDNTSHTSEVSSFHGSTHKSSTSQYSAASSQTETVEEDDSVDTPANYFIVSPLPREWSLLPLKPNPKKKKQKEEEKAVMKPFIRVKKKLTSGGEVELVYGNKAHLKHLGMLQTVRPLQRVRALTRMATFSKPHIQLQESGDETIQATLHLQGSGDATKSLPDEDDNDEVDKREESDIEEIKKKKFKWNVFTKSKKEKEKETDKDSVNAPAVSGAQLKEEINQHSTQYPTNLPATRTSPKRPIGKNLAELLDSVVCSEKSHGRKVLDIYNDDVLDESTEVLYKFGTTYVRVTPQEVCRIEPVKDKSKSSNQLEKKKAAKAAKTTKELKEKEEANVKKAHEDKRKAGKILQEQMRKAQKKHHKEKKAEARENLSVNSNVNVEEVWRST